MGIALALATRRADLLLIGAWAALLVAFSNPHWLPVPGAGALDSVTVFSSLFFPAALAIGFLVQRLQEVLARPAPRLSGGLVAAGLCAAAVWGAVQIPPLFEPNDALADASDRQAARWMLASLPADARLLVNSAVRPWNPDYVVPTDGGYWMPLLARRATTLLPLVYPGERGVAMSDVERMEQLSRASVRIGAPETVAQLRSSRVTHVYVGARGGPIDEAALAQSPAFRRVYQRGAVSIYELRSETAQTDPEPMLSASGEPSPVSTP
jgi:hypothetical protein